MTAERSDGARGGESGAVTGLRACGGRRSSLPRRRGQGTISANSELRVQRTASADGVADGREASDLRRVASCPGAAASASPVQPRASRISVARTSARPRQSPRGISFFLASILAFLKFDRDGDHHGRPFAAPSPMGDSSGPAAGGVPPPVLLVVASGRSLALIVRCTSPVNDAPTVDCKNIATRKRLAHC